MSVLNMDTKDKEPRSDGYSYFDTPDGEDCMKKLFFCTKKAGYFGLFASTMDVLLYSHPKGYRAILGRYAYVTLPITAMGAAFSAATCAATNIRKKDDQVNYAIGGLAVGGIWGVWKKSYKFGVYGGFALAFFAVIIKDSFQNNWPLFNPITRKSPYDPFWIRQDWSLTKDPGRTWKRGDEI
ncbi:NADH dehydrogenase [ubiquinone] 1 alpha subcomplex subunit 11 [Halyomorpha halys]|uniref:NADH dehydrogenase [ubiquinone] 1 alpha subcomplex subunit 11 n=1 Tax=Halyomorpha halys TaxID=286706 RepID=UPI0006D4FABB|nr:NADH dehydrogenase [ubiquinone] 1 alpha subcomplex subunit 11 [Halyomorpha halys]